MTEHELPPDESPETGLDEEPTPEELAAAEALREALEGRAPENPDAELARALKLALDPRPIDALAHRRILDRVVPKPSPLRSILVPFAGLAAAAAVALFVSSAQQKAPVPSMAAGPAVQLQVSRPTSNLFEGQFPQTGETSKRVDTIAVARERDLRGNRFAKWGVR